MTLEKTSDLEGACGDASESVLFRVIRPDKEGLDSVCRADVAWEVSVDKYCA